VQKLCNVVSLPVGVISKTVPQPAMAGFWGISTTSGEGRVKGSLA